MANGLAIIHKVTGMHIPSNTGGHFLFTPVVNLSVLFIVAMLVLTSLAGITPRTAVASALPDTILKVKLSVVAVGTLQKTRRPPSKFLGTGFVVGDGTLVVTNFHVIPELLNTERKEQLTVFVDKTDQTSARVVKVVAEDRRHDLALLKMEGSPLPALKITDSARVREGEQYAFTGFPIGAVLGHYPVTHQGIVSSITPIAVPVHGAENLTVEMIRRLNSPYRVFQLDAIAYPGNSGSPLYHMESGDVVGIVNSVYVKESKEAVLEKPSGITYAIPSSHISKLLVQYRKQQGH